MTATPTDDRAALQQLLGHGPVAYYRAFAAVGGGVTAGVFLSQLFYWHGKGRDPDGWIYKTQAAWEDETGLSRREQETARRNLRQRGIIEEKLAGIPATLHYRINVDRLAALLAERRRALPPAPPSVLGAAKDVRTMENRESENAQPRKGISGLSLVDPQAASSNQDSRR